MTHRFRIALPPPSVLYLCAPPLPDKAFRTVTPFVCWSGKRRDARTFSRSAAYRTLRRLKEYTHGRHAVLDKVRVRP